MNGKPKGKDRVEISSDQLKAELTEIKERVGALETIASISNRQVVEAYVREHLRTDRAKEIMKECEDARTRAHLIARFGFKSAAALDHHLSPLREDDLLHTRFDEDGTQTFEWSNLFRRLPKTTLKKILSN